MSQHASVHRQHNLVAWEKCGYCSLLFQHPALAESSRPCLRLYVTSPPYRFTHFIPQQSAAPVFPRAKSRAPPIRTLKSPLLFAEREWSTLRRGILCPGEAVSVHALSQHLTILGRSHVLNQERVAVSH
ncbi:DUF2946 domain-containing protein [Pseudomonas sp. NFR09]|uniref:DUF2946 domain-containing protein n=1 Tax=Pseudomonas sp. NFR09 TaxID=1566249 RepID=UPI002114755B|nr:DUF2946 domain-containing protein [Pseudomonas sp. NFR09]